MRSLPRSPTNTSAAPFLRPFANFCAQHSNEVHGHASQKGKSIQRIVYSKKEASGSDASFVVRPSGFPLSGINLESAAHSKKTCLTAGFFVVRPSGFPLSGINLESAAHSKKTCLTAGFFVVRPSGFEPLAYRVGVCHSIQLSYGRIFSKRYYSKVRTKCKAGFSVPI